MVTSCYKQTNWAKINSTICSKFFRDEDQHKSLSSLSWSCLKVPKTRELHFILCISSYHWLPKVIAGCDVFHKLVHSSHLTGKTRGRNHTAECQAHTRPQTALNVRYHGQGLICLHFFIEAQEFWSSEWQELKSQRLIKKFKKIWTNRFLVCIHFYGARLPGFMSWLHHLLWYAFGQVTWCPYAYGNNNSNLFHRVMHAFNKLIKIYQELKHMIELADKDTKINYYKYILCIKKIR